MHNTYEQLGPELPVPNDDYFTVEFPALQTLGGRGTWPSPQTDIGSTCLGHYYDGQFGSTAICDLTTRHAHWNITTLEGINTYTVDVSYSGNGRNHDNADFEVGTTSMHLPEDICQRCG